MAAPLPVESSESSLSLPRWWLSAAATILMSLAVAALIGWVADIRFLYEPISGFPPLRPYFAVGLGVAGWSLWALSRGPVPLALAGGAALILIGLTATTGVVSDQWPLQLVAGHRETSPALARGLILLLTGIAVMLTCVAPRWATVWNLVGLSGVTLLALSLLMLASRLLGLVEQTDSPMTLLLGAASQTMIGGFVIGVIFTRAAWGDVGFSQAPPAWTPWATGCAALVGLVLLWRALLLNQAQDLRHVVQAAANSAAVKVAGSIESAFATVDQLALRTTDLRQPAWVLEGSNPRSSLGLSGLATSDSIGVIVASNPSSVWSTFDRADVSSRLRAVDGAVWPDRHPRYLRLGRDRFAAAIPVYFGERHVGFAVALIGLQLVLPSEILDSTRFGFRLAFGDQTVAGDAASTSSWLEQADVYAATPTGRLEVWPRSQTINTMRSNLPNVVFAIGLGVAILLPLSTQLARTSWTRARVIERGQLYAALERGADGVFEIDLLAGSIRLSPNLWQHLGYSMARLPIPHVDWVRLIHPDDIPRYDAGLNASLADGGQPFECQFRLRANDGSWHWVVARGRVSERTDSGAASRMLGIIGDVTERQQVEEARDASEKRYRAMFDSAFQFQALLAPDGSCLEVNRTALGQGSVDVALVRGLPFWNAPWWRGSAEMQARLEAVCRAAAEGVSQRFEAEAQANGEAKATLDVSIKPLFNADGAVEQLLVEGRDVTERNRAESLLREVEILATMGRVAAKVAHEINNPLAGIQNSFLLIKDAIPVDHPHYRYVGAIEREIGRISSVTRQLYETFRLERGGALELPEAVISDTVALVRELNQNAPVTIITELRKAFPEGAVPAAIMRQAVYNLVQNAVDASPAKGEIRVTTEAVPGGYELRVRDQGPGVPTEVRQRIFDPFYTTKPQSLRPGGLGLGLYLVRRSVEAVGGTVRLQSPPGGGTEFIIWFPSLRSRTAGVNE